jgi:hypothetical protein
MGFEHANPMFEWAKTFYALDCAVTVIGHHGRKLYLRENSSVN